ncbi:MAG: universal stress protein [Saprospiraceae bacterium]|nr:universal stress protein [Saprospiraceae bacterium]
MRKYLVPVGDTQQATNTLQFAIDLATDVGAEIYVVHIVGTSTRTDTMGRLSKVLVEDSEKALQAVIQNVDTKAIKVMARPFIGKAEQDIERIGKGIGADLIILSSTTAQYHADYFLGKVSGALAKYASIPVLVVPQVTTYRPFKHILFAFKSGVMKAKSVKESLQIMIERWGAKIVPLQIITPNMAEEEKVISTSLLLQAAAPKIVQSDSVLEPIRSETEANAYDLVCMIRRKRSFLEKLLEGDAVKRKDFETHLPLLILN